MYDTVENYLIIRPPFPVVQVYGDTAICEGETVYFGVDSLDYVYENSYEWDFGYEGETSTQLSPSFIYNEPGVYTAKLVVEGDGGIMWDYRIITVNPEPEVDFSFLPKRVYVQSQTLEADSVDFYNHTKFGEEFQWFFGDGQTDSIKDPKHVYNEPGEYYVTLYSRSSEGCIDSYENPEPVIVLDPVIFEYPTVFYVNPEYEPEEYFNPEQSLEPNLYVFYPKSESVEKFKLEIYNRWGTIIFESDDVTHVWNGYINHKPAKQDVYVWRAKVTFANGLEKEYFGDVTVIHYNQVNNPEE
jgi:gliding motility-associated-like protein